MKKRVRSHSVHCRLLVRGDRRCCNWPDSGKFYTWLPRLPVAQLALLLHLLVKFGDIFQALVLIADTFGHDAVVERNGRGSPTQFMHLKRAGGFLAHVQPLAVAIRGEEDVVFHSCVHGLCEAGIQDNSCRAAGKLCGAGIFEPVSADCVE